MPWEDKKLDKKNNPRLIFENSSASLLLEAGTGNNDLKTDIREGLNGNHHSKNYYMQNNYKNKEVEG